MRKQEGTRVRWLSVSGTKRDDVHTAAEISLPAVSTACWLSSRTQARLPQSTRSGDDCFHHENPPDAAKTADNANSLPTWTRFSQGPLKTNEICCRSTNLADAQLPRKHRSNREICAMRRLVVTLTTINTSNSSCGSSQETLAGSRYRGNHMEHAGR